MAIPVEPFRFIEPMRDVEALGPWSSLAGGFTKVAGYTAFGDFILVDPASGEFAILLTMLARLEPTGYTDAAAFRATFLTDPEIVEHVARPSLAGAIAQRLGPLNSDEVYFPVPYPFLGGSGAPESFDKGNIWVFAIVAAQSHGIAATTRPRA